MYLISAYFDEKAQKTMERYMRRIAFEVMQEEFAPFDANVVKLGLAKTNPHEDLWTLAL